MDSIYWIIITALLLLAAFDLINGVANDAVNFLNSAIGSKAAPVRVILTVASIGVLVGACFSGGMMEVARNGIFHPDMFSYHEVMLLFLGVMISEVILLDTFNTFGLPTSTTVSLVFGIYPAFENGTDRMEKTEKVKEQVDAWQEQIDQCSKDYEKVKKIHDLICEKVYYNQALVNSDFATESTEYSQSVYSVLCTDKTLCDR